MSISESKNQENFILSHLAYIDINKITPTENAQPGFVFILNF